MEVRRQPNPQLFHGVNDINNIIRNDVNVRSINDNKMWVGMSMSRVSPYCEYEPPRRKEVNNVGSTEMERSSKTNQTTLSWWNDNDSKRKRRVARYKAYSSESKLKGSLKKGFRSIKIKCMNLVHGL